MLVFAIVCVVSSMLGAFVTFGLLYLISLTLVNYYKPLEEVDNE